MLRRSRRREQNSANTLTRSLLCFTCTLPLLICIFADASKAGTTDFDPTEHVDTNLIDMVVTNFGSFGYDTVTGRPGLVYPNGTGRTAVFAAGLWMGALVNEELRVSVAEYSMTFGPGPIIAPGQWADREDDRYRTYKIAPGDTRESNLDFAEWPVEDGAPLGDDGWPRIQGQQMLWSLYNDLDPALRTNQVATADPLGIEVQQTTFADYWYGTPERTVFLEWKIFNKGLDNLSDAYVSIWVDPDLGAPLDDLVGCDSLLSLGYCYNSNNNDDVYGTTPPAVGTVLVQGPIIPSPGDSAYVSGRIIDDYRNLPLTAFSKWINGTDPDGPESAYFYMQGLNKDGEVVIDPITGYPTRFIVPGDPVTQEGWIDENPSDRRMFLTSGPFEIAPGDSQVVAVAVVVGHGPDRLASITDLREHAAVVPDLFRTLVEAPQPPPPYLALAWTWSPDPRWLTGVEWGGSTFFGGIGFGHEFFGSTLDESDYVEVEIRFDSSEITTCARYDRNQNYAWLGSGTFRGSAYDISNPDSPRRLNICFTEYSLLDGIWEPDNSDTGGREYLFIMNSDYNDGADYNDENFGPEADVLYGCWLSLRGSYSFLETDPAVLTLVIPTSDIADEDLMAETRLLSEGNLKNFIAFPNPVRDRMTVTFDLSHPSPVSVAFLDASGRLVDRPIVDRPYGPGSHRIDWLHPQRSTRLPAGVYFCRIRVGGEVLSRRVVMLR